MTAVILVTLASNEDENKRREQERIRQQEQEKEAYFRSLRLLLGQEDYYLA